MDEVFFGGGGDLHICIIYVHTHTHMARCKHVYSMMIIKNTLMHAACISVFFQNSDEEGAMAKYSDVMRGRYVCGMIVI